MAESSTILSLTQLCDLALNTTDIGVVNFNVLRGLLQVMIKQLGLHDTKVEYRGADSEKIQSYMSSAKPGTITLTEYSVSSDKKEQPANAAEQVVLIQSEPGTEAQFTVTMTKEYFDSIEQKIITMQNQIKELHELPGNLKLFENMKEGGNTPVLDMFQILSVQKRMDAVEQGMEKVASMIESVLKGTNLTDIVIEGDTPDANVLKQILQRIDALEGGGGRPSKPGKPLEDTESIANLKQDVALIKEMLGTFQPQSPLEETDDNKSAETVETKVNNLEIKYTDFQDQINSLDTGFSRLTSTMQEKIEAVEKDIGEILEKMQLIPQNPEGASQSTLIAEMRTQLLSLQEELENVVDNVKKLTDETAGKEHTMDILVEQIELLKTVKADREDLEDALAEKADACQINRKVSYEQFDQACGDMAKTLDEAINKLTQQEQVWTLALTNIQTEVGTKMDKNELNPLRDFINSKLKALQDKFKALTAMKKEQEAAGTKTRFLKNVNCISCDNEVVMRKHMEPNHMPQPYALPPPKSMGPYLAYELDQLRKQQKPTSKNLNVFENALLTSRTAKSPDHLCTRYCGGSHTVTSPHQRVTRLGHFLEQWGPEIGPVNEVQIRGTDGKVYKGRDEQELRARVSDKNVGDTTDATAAARAPETK
ncbi:unnamed protein product [Psylliodes chrysocephalus]|uniref:DUF4795 domain-containing protein n=1 Tax=Psylliodes chrysocephalus TaxID=3402493 RepID=A0A9P0CRY5_9CUCU|nr:unnamed protein product [Psylliodes chrysocephala]